MLLPQPKGILCAICHVTAEVLDKWEMIPFTKAEASMAKFSLKSHTALMKGQSSRDSQIDLSPSCEGLIHQEGLVPQSHEGGFTRVHSKALGVVKPFLVGEIQTF